MAWFSSLDSSAQVALIAPIVVTIITGIFGLIKKVLSGKHKSNSTTINQTSSGSNNTFIGIQNNHKGGKTMNDKTEINQNAGLGSHGNTFIAEQYIGLSVADATHMALSMFREYYPQLREELLSDLRKMLEEKLENIPSENIVPPSPRIAVPTLQNASITEDIEIENCMPNYWLTL